MGRPAPAGIRTTLRAAQHPALVTTCTHCGARPHQHCRLRTTGRVLDRPHDTRQLDAAVVLQNVCPVCQVTNGTPCRRENGQPYPGIHPARRRP